MMKWHGFRLFKALFAVFCLLFGGVNSKEESGEGMIKEQALFSGFYQQGYIHGNGSPISFNTDTDNTLRFNIKSREFDVLSSNLTEEYIYSNHLYSDDKINYEFAECDNSIYLNGDALKSNVEIGPKNSQVCSTCKIRAYYYDVPSFFGPQAVMYDFTGFLVGDSLLITTAHGLFLDVTSGIFDDGISNYYMPGKIEVYGAIGLSDEWHEGYRYYSECEEIFLDAEYMSNRTINNDWALLRLNKPLGRELSYRVLVPESQSFSDLSVIGYPYWNQECHVSTATNGTILSNYGQFSYSTETLDGMSGSPLCVMPFYENQPIMMSYDSRLNPCLVSRLAYGMHTSYDQNNNVGYGLRFTYELVDLVDALNSKYRPSEIDILNTLMTESMLSNECIKVNDDYFLEISSNGFYMDDGSIKVSSFNGEKQISFDFNFPISSLNMNICLNNNTFAHIHSAFMTYIDRYGDDRRVDFSFGRMVYEFDRPIKSFSFRVAGFDMAVTEFEVSPEWNYISEGVGGPSYISNEIAVGGDNNCVSYALKHLINESVYQPKDGLGIAPEIYPPSNRNFKFLYLTPALISKALEECLSSEVYNCSIYSSKKYDDCTHGGYKIAVVCDPFNYYHVLRQNVGGLWSHFLPNLGVFDVDFNGLPITNPEEAILANYSFDTLQATNYWGEIVRISEPAYNITSFIKYYEVCIQL